MCNPPPAELHRFPATALLAELELRCRNGAQIDTRTFLKLRSAMSAVSPEPPPFARQSDDWLVGRLREAIDSGDRADIRLMLDLVEERLRYRVCDSTHDCGRWSTTW